MKKVMFCAALALALVTVGCGGGGGEEAASSAPAAAPEAAPAAAPAAGGGGISGMVMYANGDTDTAINMDADPQCAGMHSDDVYTESIVAADGHLANVFVYVKEGAGSGHSAPSEPALLDQEGCLYKPHVMGVMVNQKVVIRNSDPTLHNVHALPTVNAEFNQGQPFQGMELEQSFDKAEVMIRFKCDVHPWMSSYMGVLDHPYFAVTGEDGAFSIDNLPAGDYVLEAWHESLGTQTQNVTVGADETVEVSFDFAA